MDKLQVLKGLLGINDYTQDDILNVYLNFAGEKIIRKAYPFRYDVVEVPKIYENLQLELAVVLYNKQGAEGQNYHSENGIHRAYEESTIGKSMLSLVTPFVGVL